MLESINKKHTCQDLSPRNDIIHRNTHSPGEARPESRDQKVFGSLETPDRLVIPDSGCIRKSRTSQEQAALNTEDT